MSWEIISANWALLGEGLAFQSWVLLGQEQPKLPIPLPVLFVGIGVAFYLIMLRPQQRERKDMALLLQNLKQNDKVVTIGGIHGTVVSASQDSETVVIRIDENCKMRMTRSAIARLVEPKDKKGEK